MPLAPAEVARAWFEEVWNQGSEQAIDRLMAPQAAMHGLTPPGAPPIVGPEAFKPFFRTFREAFPDIHIEVDDVLSQGDRVAVKCTVTGTHDGASLGTAPTHRPVTITGMGIATVKNGQIVEGFNTFDFMSLYQQIGLVKPPV